MRLFYAAPIVLLLCAGCANPDPVQVRARILAQQAQGQPVPTPAAAPVPECGLPARFDTLAVQMVGLQPVVHIGMDDATATMVLDTGASETIVTTGLAARFNARAAQPAAQRSFVGIDGRTSVQRGFVDTLTLGTATLRQVNLTISPASLGTPTQPRDGLLGLDLLGLFDMDIDLAGGRVKLYRGKLCPETTSPWSVPATELKARRAKLDPLFGAEQLPANRAEQRAARLEVPVVLDGKIVWALIDTGATNTVVSGETAAAVGVTEAMLATDPVGQTLGAGGKTALVHWHGFNSLRVGGENLPQPRLLIGPLPAGTAMLLGADYLRNHRIWLSYATARVFVAKEKVAD